MGRLQKRSRAVPPPKPDYSGLQWKPPNGQPQQGGLFRQPKPVDAHRYAGVGFTPARVRRVSNFLQNNVYITTDWPREGDARDGVNPLVKESNKSTRNPSRKRQQRQDEAFNRVTELIARSDVPIDHLRGLGQIHVTNEDDRRASGRYSPRGSFAGSESELEKPLITLYQGADFEGRTLLHEIGHHHSLMEGTEHSGYRGAISRGAEEAYAENYKWERHRPHPAEKVPDRFEYYRSSYDDIYGWHPDYTPNPMQSHNQYMLKNKRLIEKSEDTRHRALYPQYAPALSAADALKMENMHNRLFYRGEDTSRPPYLVSDAVPSREGGVRGILSELPMGSTGPDAGGSVRFPMAPSTKNTPWASERKKGKK